MKDVIAKILPEFVKRPLVRIMNWLRLQSLFAYDKRVFSGHYGAKWAALIFHTHQIEKAMTYMHFDEKHGTRTLRNIRKDMEGFGDTDTLVYQNALAALKAYFGLHTDAGIIAQKKRVLGDVLYEEVAGTLATIGGFRTIKKASKSDNKKLPFDQLAANRYSVRDFSDEPVDVDIIKKSVKIATKTPTACNRQSPRVTLITKKSLIADALRLQGGVAGYTTPPMLLLVTADNEAYLGANERHQAYVDGGLFMMSLLYALEFNSVAAVPLHTMFPKKIDLVMRRLLDVPQSHSFVAFIAIGHFRDSNKVCKSFRLPVDDILRIIK